MALTNAEIKEIRALSQKKYRDELGMFVVEGEKLVREALDSGFKVERTVRRDEVGEAVMERVSGLSSPPPVLAVVRQRPQEPFVSPAAGLCLALDSVRDPGNLGTILRLADWFGVQAVYASPDTVEAYNPKVIQASMGSIFRAKLIYCDIPAVCGAFAKEGRQVFGTFLGGASVYGSELPSDALLVMGNEADGISPKVAAKVTSRITIPSFAPDGTGPESLNVATATAVCLSEFRRRK